MTMDEIAVWLLKGVPLVVGGIFLFQGLRALIRSIICRQWPKAEGEVVASQVTEIRLRGAGEIIHSPSGYVPQVEYRFSWKGQTLRGSCIAFGQKITATPYPAAKALVDAYQPGSKVTVLHHPRNPSLAALKTEASGPSLVSLAAGFALICLGALIS